ncbi:MAG: hypothetical protein IJI66_15355 [Erysipelotrichaceae bacterium]|nr:hypothetical protein [Erysipelotrichaceae bacterium]
MQLKIYKRSTILLGLVVLIDIISIVSLIMTRDKWAGNKLPTIIAFVLFLFLLSTIYSYYDLNADKNMIKKAVANGDVALAKIKDGTFVRFGRDARLKNHVYWKLNVDLFDNDMKKFETTIIEKFSTHQTSIPKGFVYVTYVEGKEEDCLIIPNIIIQSIPEYKVLTDDYEKALKPKYLNAFIKDGLILQTYENSLKALKEENL